MALNPKDEAKTDAFACKASTLLTGAGRGRKRQQDLQLFEAF
jgi:hypothetical protein